MSVRRKLITTTPSALLVQLNGRGLVFPVAIQSLMSFSSACTEVWTPRRIRLSVSGPNQRSINRPSRGGIRCYVLS